MWRARALRIVAVMAAHDAPPPSSTPTPDPRPDAFRRLGLPRGRRDRRAARGRCPTRRWASRAGRAEMEARLREPLPEHGRDPRAGARRARCATSSRPGCASTTRASSRSCPARAIPSACWPTRWPPGFSVFAGTWLASPGAAMVELVVLDWLRELCGLPADHRGPVRQRRLAGQPDRARRRAARSAPASSARARPSTSPTRPTRSVRARAARGRRGAEHVRVLAGDRDAATRPRRARPPRSPPTAPPGGCPPCVVATAGTTGTGAVDPLEELRARLRRARACGCTSTAPTARRRCCARGPRALRGLELADSLTLDPHKWLFQPLEAGCLLVRDGAALRAHLQRRARLPARRRRRPTARSTSPTAASSSRASSARSKLWMSLKVFGAAAFRAAIEHGLALAEHAEAVLARDPAWEVVTPARLGIVTFRAVVPGPRRRARRPQRRLPAAALADGFAFLSTHRVARSDRAAALHDQPPHDPRGRRAHDRPPRLASHKELLR